LRYTIFNSTEKFLIEKVNFVEKLLFSGNSDSDINTIINKYQYSLESLKWDDDTGYLYIFDQNGKMLFHPINKSLVGKNIFETVKDKPELINFLKAGMKEDDYYDSYIWPKPAKDENEIILDKKYVYLRKEKKHNIYIAAGVYKSKIDEKVLDLVFDNILTNRFGENNYGYFWINDFDYIVKSHPLNPELIGRSVENFQTLDGKKAFIEMNQVAKKGGGFVEYEWIRPDNLRKDKKISYVAQIDDYPLVIGAGFYLSELDELLKHEKKRLEQLSEEYISKILLLLAILSFFALIISRYISVKIQIVELKEKEQLNFLEQYKMLLDKSSVVSKTDLNGNITYINQGFERLSGYSKDEVIGKKHNIIKHPDATKNKFKRLWEILQKGDNWKGIMKNKDKYGNTYYNSTIIVPIKNSDGEIIEYISSGTDITSIYKLQEEKERAYLYDEFTGLKSKNALNKELNNKDGFMILINIRDFSKVNTLIGYDGANEILEDLANLIREKSNYVYRIYGDIFAIFYENISIEKAQEKASTILFDLDKHKFAFRDIDMPIYINIGISNVKPYLKTSEIAIKENKHSFNKISVYTEKMDDKETAQKNFSMLNKVKVALQEDLIRPFFQPIVDLETKEPIKYEALVRLIDEDKAISPFFFLDIAMKSKLYPEITKRVFKKSIEFVKKNNIAVSVNISYQDIINVDVLNYISIVLQANKNIASMITFEILESDEIDDYEIISSFISVVKRYGAKLAIDDFGSGYSNFTQLLNMEPDIVKIDGSLIKDIHMNKNSKDIVEAILILTKKKNIRTVAEFIDNERVHEIVKNLGVNYGQGFLYSPPIDLLKKEEK
jgi:PAS domain S-box-containing protein